MRRGVANNMRPLSWGGGGGGGGGSTNGKDPTNLRVRFSSNLILSLVFLGIGLFEELLDYTLKLLIFSKCLGLLYELPSMF